MVDLGADVRMSTTRRTLVRGAAWSVPVVAVAATAPAYASSTCADGAYRLRWEQNYNENTRVATAELLSTSGTGAVGNAALTLTVSNKFNGSMQAGSTGGYSNLTTSPGNIGGTGTRGLTIMQRVSTNPLPTPRENQNQVVTLTFNRPVWNLAFTLTDIDSSSGQYQDRIFVSGAPASYTLQSQVQGAGTAGTPWQPTGPNLMQDPVRGNGGNVAVDYTGLPRAAVYTITYWNDQNNWLSANGLQGVFVSNMTFSSETCA
jgi:hypothetical protein